MTISDSTTPLTQDAAKQEQKRAKWRREHERYRDKRLAYNRAYRLANKEKLRAQDRAYKAAHHEEGLARGRVYNANHREARRAYNREYQRTHTEDRRARDLENHDHIRTLAKAWREAHKAEQKQAKQAWVKANRDHHRAQVSRYAQAHPEQVRATKRASRAKHRDKIRAYNEAYKGRKNALARQRDRSGHSAQRRARLAQAPLNDFTEKQWREMKQHYDHRCVYCDRQMQHLTQDHLTPLMSQGSHTLHNIVPACRSCNSRKGDGPVLVPVQPMLFTLI